MAWLWPGLFCLAWLGLWLPGQASTSLLLEEHCAKRGFQVIFLPKFHCELNPLEMVWGRSKYHYRLFPPSTKEEDLEANMIVALKNKQGYRCGFCRFFD